VLSWCIRQLKADQRAAKASRKYRTLCSRVLSAREKPLAPRVNGGCRRVSFRAGSWQRDTVLMFLTYFLFQAKTIGEFVSKFTDLQAELETLIQAQR